MGSEKSADINLTELLLKISSDVSAIKTDMQNFKDSYKNEKENLLAKIEDVRKDCDEKIKAMKEAFEEKLKQQDAQIKLLTTYTEALRSAKDKSDAKKYRSVIAFILVGLGGMLLALVPSFFIFIIKSKIGG
jgi:hypothetical protein